MSAITPERRPWSAATLALYSDTHPAAPVSAALGLVPTKTHEIGDANQSKKTGRVYGHFTHSAWLYEIERPAPAADGDGFAALRELLAHLPDIGAALAELRPHYRTVIRWSGTVSVQGNFTMDAALIAKLAALGCDLYGTAYHEDDDGIEDTADQNRQPAIR